jgi:hypothetical protein
MGYATKPPFRPCGFTPEQCDNHKGGDIRLPMCYWCEKNPYIALVNLLAPEIHDYKNPNIQYEIARSGTRMNAKIAAWRVLKLALENGYSIKKEGK